MLTLCSEAFAKCQSVAYVTIQNKNIQKSKLYFLIEAFCIGMTPESLIKLILNKSLLIFTYVGQMAQQK